MPINRTEYQRGDWIEISLPNHLRDEYSDILEGRQGQFPEAYIYTVPSPFTTEVDEIESRWEQAQGLKADAQIDFPGEHAVVRLDAETYAECPSDELTEEAEDILAGWASDCRARLAREGTESEEVE